MQQRHSLIVTRTEWENPKARHTFSLQAT